MATFITKTYQSLINLTTARFFPWMTSARYVPAFRFEPVVNVLDFTFICWFVLTAPFISIIRTVIGSAVGEFTTILNSELLGLG